MKTMLLLICLAVYAETLHAQQVQKPLPIIDMHLHAYPADANGPPPIPLCIPVTQYLPPYDLGRDNLMSLIKNPPCSNPIWSPMTDEEVMQGTIEVMERRNIIGVLSATPDRLETWMAAPPDRFIPSLQLNVARDWAVSPDSTRLLIKAGRVMLLGEVSNQYAGIEPNDERMEPYWALAEELDIPVTYHMGEGPPYVSLISPDYRASLSNPYLLEEVLSRHPKLRISVMHYGSPHVDEMIAMLWIYPQLYVDIGGMTWHYPREYFYAQLKKFIDAGFGKRVMFGSDQMNWPGVIEPSIATIEEAPFLSQEQKRDILYNNAARFLRLTEEQIKAHHH